MSKRKLVEASGPESHFAVAVEPKRICGVSLEVQPAAPQIAFEAGHKRERDYLTHCQLECLHGAQKRICTERAFAVDHVDNPQSNAVESIAIVERDNEIMRLRKENDVLRAFISQHVERVRAENIELRRYLQHALGHHDAPNAFSTSHIVRVC